MKTLAKISELHEMFAKKFGIQSRESAAQSSQGWFELKLGVLSASNASAILAKKDSATRATYMAELVAQVCTGQFEEINSKYLDWGNQHEDAARSLYEFQNNVKVTGLPFVFKDDSFRVGCSPDALVNETKGMEIKCPYNPTNFIQFLTMDKIKPEYEYQVQFTMWVLGAEEWDMVQYHPNMIRNQIKTLTIKRNNETIKRFEDVVPEFISDMDKMLAICGFSFGQQWTRLAEREKAEAFA